MLQLMLLTQPSNVERNQLPYHFLAVAQEGLVQQLHSRRVIHATPSSINHIERDEHAHAIRSCV